jgi:hypothetical protein
MLCCLAVGALLAVPTETKGKPIRLSGTITLDQDPNNIHFGDTISFTVSPSTGVGLDIFCYEGAQLGGNEVYQAYQDPYVGAPYVLYNSYWASLPDRTSECLVILHQFGGNKGNTLQTSTFLVLP